MSAIHRDCVLVNIWLAKDQDGYTTTSSEGGRLSKTSDPGEARCGHASMIMHFAKDDPYVSFWPGGKGGVLNDSFESDCKLEGSLPDVVVYLYQLNMKKMLKSFNDVKKRVDAGQLKWELEVADSEDVTSSQTTLANCSTFVLSLLKKGGFASPRSVYYAYVSARGPSDQDYYKLTKCNAGDRWWGIFNGALWTHKYFTPKALLLHVASASEASNVDKSKTKKVMLDPSRVAVTKEKPIDKGTVIDATIGTVAVVVLGILWKSKGK